MNISRIRFAFLATLALTFTTSGCSTAPPKIQQGESAEITFDGLHKVDNSAADEAWAAPDFDISEYTKIMLVGAGIEYAPAKNKGRTSMERSRGGPYFIDDETRVEFEALVQQTFVEEMMSIEGFELVGEVGPDVLIIRGGLLDVESFVPSDEFASPGRGGVFLRSVGEATLVLELRDSETGAILARSVDRRAAEPLGGRMMESNSITNAAEIRRLIRFWAQRLREGLDGFKNHDD